MLLPHTHIAPHSAPTPHTLLLLLLLPATPPLPGISQRTIFHTLPLSWTQAGGCRWFATSTAACLLFEPLPSILTPWPTLPHHGPTRACEDGHCNPTFTAYHPTTTPSTGTRLEPAYQPLNTSRATLGLHYSTARCAGWGTSGLDVYDAAAALLLLQVNVWRGQRHGRRRCVWTAPLGISRQFLFCDNARWAC